MADKNPYEKYVQEENPYAKYLKAGAKGMLQGGLPGAATAVAGTGMNEANEVLEKFAYGIGGKVTDYTGSPELGFAANVATQAVPTVLGGEVAKLASPLFKGAARSLMQSALKPTKAALQSGKAAKAVNTMLDEGVNVSRGGVAKMQSMVDDLSDQVSSAITGSNARINKNDVASRIQDVLTKYEVSPDPDDIKVIEQVWSKFLTHPKLAGQKDMPIQLAQAMKRAGGTKLGDAAYGSGLKPAAERDAWKAIVRGLKEEISKAEPKVAPLNARESDLINASKIAQNRVLMDANKNPLGLGALITQPWMVPVWMWDRSPVGKSLAARALYQGNRVLPGLMGQAAAGSVMAPLGQPPVGDLYR